MSAIKEIYEHEKVRMDAGVRNELHLFKEGSFLRAYGWSAWLACRFLHDFKVNKREFKDVGAPLAFIGFPESSLEKWLPEGVKQEALGEKHLLLRLSDQMLAPIADSMVNDYAAWFDNIPLTTAKDKLKREKETTVGDGELNLASPTITGIMQQVLKFPIESKSPIDSMNFLADVKRQIASLI